MTWNAMDPAEVCDLLEFWDSAAWPLSQSDAQQLGVEQFGWTPLVTRRGIRYLDNPASGLNRSSIGLTAAGDHVMCVDMRATDAIKDVTDESLEFLGDRFALLVREGESRWGAARVVREDGRQNASWNTPGGGRIRLSASAMAVLAEYRTPQGTDLDQRERRAQRRGLEE